MHTKQREKERSLSAEVVGDGAARERDRNGWKHQILLNTQREKKERNIMEMQTQGKYTFVYTATQPHSQRERERDRHAGRYRHGGTCRDRYRKQRERDKQIRVRLGEVVGAHQRNRGRKAALAQGPWEAGL